MSTLLPSRNAATPTPPDPNPSLSTESNGILFIKVIEARGLEIPSVAPNLSMGSLGGGGGGSSISGGVSASMGGRKRDSIQRQSVNYLPYLILTFDLNQIVIDALSGTYHNPSYVYSTSFDVSRPITELTVDAYLRTRPSSNGLTHNRTESEIKGDLWLASTKVELEFDLRKVTDKWYAASNGKGEFRLQIGYRPTQREPLTIDSFELLKVIGKGSFGKVMQVRKKDSGRIYALKTIRKAHIVSRSEVTHTLAERTVLTKVTSPFIVPLKFSFQSTDKLYLVLAFVNGGELFHHLQNSGRFSEERSRFYAAELMSALDHLHSLDVVYRDLKPENILIDLGGHIQLCDFGLCKLNMSKYDKTNTFSGTPEYLSPELILGNGYTRSVDFWTLGTLLYEMLSGLPPFYEEDHQTMYRRIVSEELSFPSNLVGDSRRLLLGLLQKDPELRLGARGAEEIKRHAFWNGIDWHALERKELVPPWRPNVESATDTSNVDVEFLSETAKDSVVVDSQLSESAQELFKGFSYEPASGLGESVQ